MSKPTPPKHIPNESEQKKRVHTGGRRRPTSDHPASLEKRGIGHDAYDDHATLGRDELAEFETGDHRGSQTGGRSREEFNGAGPFGDRAERR
ncbi:MAG TPA: hypothetical protein VMF30_01340 [Pirellulales bacterium]|nr:hypothetical protein [Pirellulales bacterium]